jgi:TPR repeat protein
LIIFIYLECWDGEPDNRPTIYQVVEWLKAEITKSDMKIEDPQLSNEQKPNDTPLININNTESQGGVLNNTLPNGNLSKLIQNFNEMNTKEIEMNIKEIDTITGSNILCEKDFNEKLVDKTNDLIFELLNKGTEWKLLNKQVIEHFGNYNISSKEVYNWLSNNQNNLISIFLLGYFNLFGIETSVNYKEAFNLFINASEKNHILAEYFVGYCYQYGYGTIKNDRLAFEYFEKVAEKNYTCGQFKIGYFYTDGIGIKKDLIKGINLYRKAAKNGNIKAIHDLGTCYKDGIEVKKDHNKAFKLFNKSAEGGDSNGIMMLGRCYDDGIGTNINKKKAFELYQESANLGNKVAQYNLGVMYENGGGITKDIDRAIYWYEKSREPDAQDKLRKLQKNQ